MTMMKDQFKTKQALIQELASLRQKIAELEQSESEHKRVDGALRESEARFAKIFNASPVTIAITRLKDGRLIDVNSAWQKVTGYSREEVIGRTSIELNSWVNPGERDRLISTIREQGTAQDFLFQLRHKSGTVFEMLMAAEVIELAGERYVLSLAQDITERKRVEEALREKSHLNQTLLDAFPCVALLLRPQTREIIASNNAAVKVGALPGTHCFSTWGQRQDPCPWCLAPALWATGEAQHLEVEALGIFWDAYWIPVAEDLYMHFAFDITERKRAEEALRESEDRYGSLFDNSIDAVLLTAPDGRILAANPEACRIFGRTEEEICRIGRAGLIDLTDPRLSAALEERVRTGMFRGELTFVRKDGTLFPGEISSAIFTDHNGDSKTSMIIRDITERKQAENALIMSEYRFKELFENMSSSVAVYEATADGKDFVLRNFNKAAEQAEQIDRKDVIGKSVIDVFPSITNMGLFEVFQRVWSTGKPEHHPVSLYKDERIESWRENYVHKLPTGEIVNIYNDITDRKKAEDTLRESEARFAKIFNASPVTVAITRLEDNRLIDVNSAWQKVTGYSREEAIDRTPFELNTWVDRGERDQLISIIRDQGTVRNFPFQLRHKSGTVFEMLMAAEVIELAGEQYMLSLAQDITERKRAEDSLRESEIKYHGLYDSTQDGIAMADIKGHFIECNRAFLDMLGYSKQEIKSMTYQQTTPVKWHEMERNIVINKILKTGYSDVYEKEYIRKDGTVFPVSMRVWATKDEAGRITGLWSIIRDITESKQAEETLRRAEENFRYSMDKSPLGVRIVTIEGETIYANRAVLDFYGYDGIEELITTPPQKRYTPESYDEFQIRREKRQRGDHEPSEYDISIVKKDGEVRHLHVFRKEVLWNGERQFQVLYNDVTKRRRAEEALIQSEKKYRDIFEMTVEGIYRSTPAGRFIIVNPAFVKICGYASAEEMTEKVTDIANQIYANPEDRLRLQKLIAAEGEVKGFEVQFKHPTKELVWVSINTKALHDEQGNIVYYDGTIEDVTERKRVEDALRASHLQLRALSGRLQSVREDERKQIAREIHDELGGALTGLKIDLSFLASSAPKSRDKTKRDSFLSKMLEMSKLIDETIGTVRKLVTELRPSILDDFGLLAALEWQLQEFQKRTGIQTEFVSTLEYINMDEELSTAVFRIFQESLTNVARHANATKVTATLNKVAGGLVLKVHDNGKGISEDDIHNTKSVGLIGMREHALFLGGTVNFSGEPSKGTTVLVQFPFESQEGTGKIPGKSGKRNK
jgi:PAS domain S-box-containing protein